MSILVGGRRLPFITQGDAGVKKTARHRGHLMPEDRRAVLGGVVGAGWEEPSQEAPGWSLCNSLGADRFLWQGVQMMPGQMQRTSPRRTALFGQCQIVMDPGLYWGWGI